MFFFNMFSKFVPQTKIFQNILEIYLTSDNVGKDVRFIQAICFVLYTFKDFNLFKRRLVSQMKLMLYGINNLNQKLIQSGFNLPLLSVVY